MAVSSHVKLNTSVGVSQIKAVAGDVNDHRSGATTTTLTSIGKPEGTSVLEVTIVDC
jgi:hypothetical protein